MTQIKIIDNFLPEDIFKEFKDIFFNHQFPWYFNKTSVYEDQEFPRFNHLVYLNMNHESFIWESIKGTIIQSLELKSNQAILRVKVNATPRTSEIVKSGLHYDIVNLTAEECYKSESNPTALPHNVAIIYLNSNDGYTFFEDGAKVDSVENRCILFPGNLKHAGTSCTNEHLRMVLNINYTI
jgi:hypothetical protein